MATNKDGLEPGQSVDFATLKRVQRQQQEARKDGTNTESRRGKRKATARKTVREPDESSVQGVAGAEEPKGSE